MEISIPDLERAAAAGWRGTEEASLGGWMLRAAAGFTGRANSALAIGDPRMPLAEAAMLGLVPAIIPSPVLKFLAAPTTTSAPVLAWNAISYPPVTAAMAGLVPAFMPCFRFAAPLAEV